ncbi:MAG: PIN domain-containing protein [Gemmatimonadota bacterium]|nr:PIN domain-containing protein [Gemmatimonadota bacterium]
MTSWLLDTGPLVGYLNAADPAHQDVGDALDGFSGQLCTTGAVITEAMHFVGGSPSGPRLLAEFVTTARIRVFDFAQPAALRRCATLMEKYADTPMDYADATLVLLAERVNCFDILTLDRRGFSTYRSAESHGFRLVLDSGLTQ